MAEPGAFIQEEHGDASPKWIASAQRADGSLEETGSDDPDELIQWARERVHSVLIRRSRAGGWFWAGEGEIPADLMVANSFEGRWPPPAEWQPRHATVSISVRDDGPYRASCVCGWESSGPDWDEGQNEIRQHEAIHLAAPPIGT